MTPPLLIGDAGGNKTEWYFSQNQQQKNLITSGFNAFTHSIDVYKKELLQNFDFSIKNVFLYISGADSDEQKRWVSKELKDVFGIEPQVENDLLGAARSVMGENAGYACILGTGSNAAFYDGVHVDKVSASLGYLLGDEGGGAYLGKQLLKAVFRNQLSDSVIRAFYKIHKLSHVETIQKIYAQKKIGFYLSSFTKFIYEHRKDPTVKNMIESVFYDFFDAFFHQKKIDHPIHFVGSVAFFFEEELRNVGTDLAIEIKTIVQSPIPGLVNYHQKDFT